MARIRSAVGNSQGITLIELLVALAVFSSAGTAVLVGVSAAHSSSKIVDGSAIAENLARNQMEYVWSQPNLVSLPGSYDSIADDVSLNINIPAGFAVSNAATEFAADAFNGSIEKVVVTITRGGQSILVLETLRVGP